MNLVLTVERGQNVRLLLKLPKKDRDSQMWQFINYQNDGWFQLKHVDTGMYLTMQDEGNLTIEAGNPLTSLPNSNRSKYFFSLPHIFGMSSYRRCSRKKKTDHEKKSFL